MEIKRGIIMLKKGCERVKNFCLWLSEKSISLPDVFLDILILIIMILLFLIYIKI